MTNARTSWQDVSEVCAGLILDGLLSPAAVGDNSLMPPYDKLLKLVKRRKAEPDALIESIGLSAYQAATQAAKAIQGTAADWPVLLENAVARHEAGMQMEKDAKRLIAGESIDLTRSQAAIMRLDKGSRVVTPLSQIQSEDTPIIPIGYEPWDDHIGGAPESGNIVIGGEPGSGKTTLLLRFGECYAKRRKKFLIFSYEMSKAQLHARAQEVCALTKAQQDLILVVDDPLTPHELAATVSRYDDIDAFGLDFSDLCAATLGEVSESSMSQVYWTVQRTAKGMGIPAFVLSQFNRDPSGDLPRLSRYRYSGAAEQSAALAVLLYNAGVIYAGAQSNDTLPYQEGTAWQIFAKSRFGFQRGLKHKHMGPGAIQTAWDAEKGWNRKYYAWKDLRSS